MVALTCPRCGAPLPPAAASDPVVGCAWCGATISAAGVTTTGSAGHRLTEAEVQPARQRFTMAVVEAMQGGAPPLEAIRGAAAAHLGTLGQSDAVARVALALASDLEASTGAKVITEPLALSRIAEAYLQALDAIRSTGAAEVHLPFLAATSKGPVELRRTLTPDLVAQLAARDPTPPKKRRRLFG